MVHPSLLERVLLAALLAAGLAGFWIPFSKVLRTIRAARKDPGWSLVPLWPRVRDLLWEVALQGKVIRERPFPGLAHAFVFWGFCAFALVTADHLAAGFGFPLFPHFGWFGRFYRLLAALFAAAVAVSIAALFFRRFLARPKWLGEHLSWESGWIALLIFVLMITYLAAYRFETGKLVWWIHTLALVAFLPLIPHTKHLHLVLGPVSVFLSRGGFSSIPPLFGDEDFGLDTGKDVTRLTALQVYSCVECGRCMEHCPANNTGKLLNPKQIALGMRDYLNEFGPASEQPLLGKHLAQEAAFQCTTCGACEYQCPVGIQHLPILIGLRRGAVNTGRWDDDYGAKLFLNLERYGNPLGMPSLERDKFIGKADLPFYDGSQEYCLWLGCMGAYDPHGREIVQSLAAILRYLDVSFGVLRKERCTGDSARRLGNDLAFGQLAEANLETLASAKVNKLLSICPHCVRTISEDWKEYGDAPPIEHHSQFLARHASRLPASPAARERIVFHDPCYLGRYLDIYDAPRDVLAHSAAPVDPPRARERSFCCGAGGGLVFLGEEKGKRVSAARAEELAATGAQTVAAACPFCNTMLRDALAAASPDPPRLADIAQIAAASIRSQ